MTSRRFFSLLAVAAIGVLPMASAADAAGPRRISGEPTPAQWASGQVQCLVTVSGQLASGEYTTLPIECWLAPRGTTAVPKASGSPPGGGVVAMSGSNVIGTHFDGWNWSGSYITVVGDYCSGGWLNLSGNWINRISSTSSPCWVSHWDGYNLTGDVEATSWGNLYWMSNRTNSLMYS